MTRREPGRVDLPEPIEPGAGRSAATKAGGDRPPTWIFGPRAPWPLLGFGGLCLALNHVLWKLDGEAELWLVVFGPLLTLFGFAALWDRRILAGGSRGASRVPLRFRLAAGAVALAALATSAWLGLVVYRGGP